MPAMEDFDRYDQGFFGRAKPEYIIVKGECLEKLKQQGYEMDCWQKGIPVSYTHLDVYKRQVQDCQNIRNGYLQYW